MKLKVLLIALALILLASCAHTDVREAELDPEGDRPPESELASAPYIEPVCDCVYIPLASDGSRGNARYGERLTTHAP